MKVPWGQATKGSAHGRCREGVHNKVTGRHKWWQTARVCVPVFGESACMRIQVPMAGLRVASDDSMPLGPFWAPQKKKGGLVLPLEKFMAGTG